MEFTERDVERFWSKVTIGGPDDCWEWQAFRKKGYGRFNLTGNMEYAHRVSYEMSIGPIPDGRLVLHTCDNPACQNPSHFFTGDDAINVADKMKKERQARGSVIGSAKLTEEQVLFIRQRAKNRYYGFCPEMAREYGVSPKTIESIIAGIGWKHVSLEGSMSS